MIFADSLLLSWTQVPFHSITNKIFRVFKVLHMSRNLFPTGCLLVLRLSWWGMVR